MCPQRRPPDAPNFAACKGADNSPRGGDRNDCLYRREFEMALNWFEQRHFTEPEPVKSQFQGTLRKREDAKAIFVGLSQRVC